MGKGIYIEDKSIFVSVAWRSLGVDALGRPTALSSTCKDVYLAFLGKRQPVENKRKRGKERWIIRNNGEIVFTYIEAKDKHGMSPSRFGRAIEELVNKGFIDITDTGMGLYKMTTFYAISERWRKYDTLDFQKVKRKKAHNLKVGFQKGNELWRHRQKKTTVVDDHGAMHIHEHGQFLVMRTHKHGEVLRHLYKYKNGGYLVTKIA